MKNLKNLKLLIILAFIISCSNNNDENSNNNNTNEITIQSISPNFGYPGDEITFNMSSTISPNSNISIFYANNNQANVTNISGNNIKHIIPSNSNDGEKKLFIDNKQISFSLSYLDMFINCTNCKEKAYLNIEENEIESTIADIYKSTNEIYLIGVSKNSNQQIKTYLIKTDLNFNIITKTLLFNKEPRSKIIFESNRFIIDNSNGVYAYDYLGNTIWTYSASLNSGLGSNALGYLTKSMIKKGSFYYLIQNAQGTNIQNPVKIVKLNSNGQLVNSIEIPEINPQNASQNAVNISEVNNKIVIFTTFCCYNGNNFGYVIIENDVLTRNVYTFIGISGSEIYIENNSIIFSQRESNIGITHLAKATLDSNNYFQIDWTKSGYQGTVIKYNSKYISVQKDKILVFNDINFNTPNVINCSSNYFNSGDFIRLGITHYETDLYMFGARTTGGIVKFKPMIGKYDLNYITN